VPDPLDILITLPDEQMYMEAYNRVICALPYHLRDRLNEVFLSYFSTYGSKETYQRLNGRTVGQVLNEYTPRASPAVIAEGEVAGVRYTLLAAQSQDEGRAEPAAAPDPAT
jgi:hypothetical protein